MLKDTNSNNDPTDKNKNYSTIQRAFNYKKKTKNRKAMTVGERENLFGDPKAANRLIGRVLAGINLINCNYYDLRRK